VAVGGKRLAAGSLQVETSRFGSFAVAPEQVVTFVEPILGFPNFRRFVLIEHDTDSPFLWLQSLDVPELAFVVIEPHSFGLADYSFEVPDSAVEKLTGAGPNHAEASSLPPTLCLDDLCILTIVTIPETNPAGITTNLMGPLLIHRHNQRALQLVLVDSPYATKTPLLYHGRQVSMVAPPSPRELLSPNAAQSLAALVSETLATGS
jgi:flagellar assembly factor FliW